MNKARLKKLLILNLPYVLIGLYATKLGEAWRLAEGTDMSEKLLHLMDGFTAAFRSPRPSFVPADVLLGIALGCLMRLVVYEKGRNAKKYRHNVEYGSARWGKPGDIQPFIDPDPWNNVILTKTEWLTMNSRPKNPNYARNKNVLVIGGSGSGKTRFFVKPNIMQCTKTKGTSLVVTDPKGTLVVECGKMLVAAGYDVRILNTINFKKSMHYNPLSYIHSETDILKLVTALIANTKGEGKAGEDFWVKAETLLYIALIGYIHYELPPEKQNFATLIDMLDKMQVREDDEDFRNEIDEIFGDLAQRKPEHFAVRQYQKYKMASGKTAKSILVSCGARLAVFDIEELREITSYDELSLDTIGDKRTALFLIMSDTDASFNFLISLAYSQLFNLLCEKADDEYGGRKKFCARIATGDYDAVIIGHSQFEKIPVSHERQEQLLQDEIAEIIEGIEELKSNNGERFSIKQLEKSRKQLELKLEKLRAEDRKDDVVTFEQLGVDRLYVDEAHSYKNLFLYTKMRNVAGISTSEAQKSSDMFMKCRYMDELTGGRGIIFATGTPVSNSMTELYTMQRYLQYGALQRSGMTHFDCWASTFGETTTAIELAPEGMGYRARTRFAKFFNLPELMNVFREVADIKTADQLQLPTPDVEYETVVVKPTAQQEEMVQALSERAAAVHNKQVDPTVDNMLKITSDGRKLGLDQRLINPLLPDDPASKVNACVGNILRIWEAGQEDKLTQLVFCDISTPKGTGAATAAQSGSEPFLADDAPQENTFNVYDDIREKLIAHGVPAEQIAFIHEANTEVKKKELFAKVRSGQVRVLMGSTAKMGAGTNVQDRLIALHDLDCPWRPGDLEQRAGRIVRQGNMNPEVSIFRYVTEATFDAYLWQTVENKQKFISQIMTSKSPVRSCEDMDETALSYAEIKALCAGDPRIKEKMDLDVDVARLKLMKADHQSKQFRLEDQLLKYFPQEVERDTQLIAGFQKDIATIEAHPLPQEDFVGMVVGDKLITDKEEAGKAILAACKDAAKGAPVEFGSYRGLPMRVQFDSFINKFVLTLHGAVSHPMEVGNDARGNITRLDNAIAQIPKRLAATTEHLATVRQQIDAARSEAGKPFPQEAELRTKSARLAELDAALNMDRSSGARQKDISHSDNAR